MNISAYQNMNIRMSTRGKRPLRNLTPNDKVRAIQRIHNGETKASVSRDIGVPESTLRGWCKNEQKLRFMCRQLGSDTLGLSNIDTPPEKRSKFELEILPSKFSSVPNYDDLGLGGLPFQVLDYTSHGEALLDNAAFGDFLKKKTLHTDAIQQMTETSSIINDSFSCMSGYSTYNMVNQLNLLTILNSKLAPKKNINDYSVLPNLYLESTIAQEEEKTKTNSPLLSVKNWAKDPAKHLSPKQTEYINDNNNNDIDCALTFIPTPVMTAPALQVREEQDSILQPKCGALDSKSLANCSKATDTNNQAGSLMDWCKMFSASLNFFAIAAAAASLHPGHTVSSNTLDAIGEGNKARTFNDLFNMLSPSVHSDSSTESLYDSEPEDLSVRSCASKISSRANSRSHSPDKSSTTSTSIHSDVDL